MLTAKKEIERSRPELRLIKNRESDLSDRVSIILVRIITTGEYRDDHGQPHKGFYVHPNRTLVDLGYMLEVDQKKEEGIWSDEERREIKEFIGNGIGDVYESGGNYVFEDGQLVGPLRSSDVIYPREETTGQRRARMLELAQKAYLAMEEILHIQYQNGGIDEIKFLEAQEAIAGIQLSTGRELYKLKGREAPGTKEGEQELLFEIWAETHPKPQKA